MKPNKNRVYCPQCGRPKIQFKTEKEAERFMLCNDDEICASSGHAPKRSYFCSVCMCWHVTSRPFVGSAPKSEPRRLSFIERDEDKTAKAGVRLVVKEIKGMLHKLNRFVCGHCADSSVPESYYTSLYQQVEQLYGSIKSLLTEAQIKGIARRMMFVKPYLA